MSDRPGEHELVHLPWRTGRKVGRTIYAVVGEETTNDDVLIGMMDTRELAAEAVWAHNSVLGGEGARRGASNPEAP